MCTCLDLQFRQSIPLCEVPLDGARDQGRELSQAFKRQISGAIRLEPHLAIADDGFAVS